MSIKEYFICDNGGYLFRVDISESENINKIKIYKYCSNLKTYEKQYIFSCCPQKVFIGKSSSNNDGNSILLEIAGGYIFIGSCIFSFITKGKIVSFHSNVGNSNSSYPYAIDDIGNYYLLIENVIINIIQEFDIDDPYDYYYRSSLITSDIGYRIPILPLIYKFQGIEKWYIDEKQYTMRYTPNPKKNYERLTKNVKNMYVVVNGIKKYISKKEYIRIIHNFGDRHGFSQLQILYIIHDRI
jgi:hypothetical protein